MTDASPATSQPSFPRVLFTPCSPANPYQALLADALRRRGVDMVMEPTDWRIDLSRRKTRGVQVVHLHWLGPLFVGRKRWVALAKALRFLWQLSRLRMAGVRIVWTVHNIFGHEREHAWLDRFVSRRVARLAHAIITHCDCAKEQAMRAYGLRDGRKFAVVPHAHYIGVYANTVPRDDARRKLQLPGDAPVFLFLGQIRPYKGVLEMIEAFTALQGAAQLVIAGKPNTQDGLSEMEQRIAGRGNIHLHARFIPDDEVQVFLNAADVVVLPYRDVLTSGGLLLAMSFGRAAIAPRLGCIPETVDDQGGFLYDPQNPAGLRDAMQQAVAAQNRLPDMGSHNRRRIEPIDWDRMAEGTAKVYRTYNGSVA